MKLLARKDSNRRMRNLPLQCHLTTVIVTGLRYEPVHSLKELSRRGGNFPTELSHVNKSANGNVTATESHEAKQKRGEDQRIRREGSGTLSGEPIETLEK